jgi:predicted phosphodiesterase
MKAIFSDVHGNSPALRAVLDDITTYDVDEIFFLGDVVNGVDPVGCLELLIEAQVSCIRGNAEENLCTPDIEGFPWKNTDAWTWIVPMFRYIRDALSTRQIETIRSWPGELHRGDSWLMHDSPVDRNEFPGIWDGLPKKYDTLMWHGHGIHRNVSRLQMSEHMSILAQKDVNKLFIGHTHEPWIERSENKTICNVGSAGLPLDGDPRPSWALWGKNRISVHRVSYDFSEFERIADASGYLKVTQRYKDMFRKGIHWRFL